MKKRVHEIAKQQGLTSKEVLAALNAAGIEAKVAASSVEEADALKALAAAGATAESKPPKAQPRTARSRRPRQLSRRPRTADGKPASDESSPGARFAARRATALPRPARAGASAAGS